jgi:hypothetical protein
MQWHRISRGKAAFAAHAQNLSGAMQRMRWQGADNRGSRRIAKKTVAGLRHRRRPLTMGMIRSPQLMWRRDVNKRLWADPEVDYRAKSAEGKVRHPVFKGIRENF